MNIGNRIKLRRTELNLTLKEIASKVGVTEATVQRWESGNIKMIKGDKLERLALSLQWSVNELMEWDSVENKANAIDSLKIILKDVYDDVIIKDYEDTGSYDVILVKNKIKICLEEIPFETLFQTVCSVIPMCVDMIVENSSKGDYETIPFIACLSNDEVSMLDSYKRLDSDDKTKIKGVMEYQLMDNKYSIKKESRNA